LVIGSGKNATKLKMDLVPPALVVRRYFADNQARIDELTAEADAATQAVDDYVEEHGGDEGLLSDAVNDKGKLTQAAAKEALKEARAADDTETIECARAAITLLQRESAAKKAAKDAQAALDAATVEKYGELTATDVKTLVLDQKWYGELADRMRQVVGAKSLALIARLTQLGRRYAETLDDIDGRNAVVNGVVADRLALLAGESRLPGFSEPW